ncbi:hypothetical protein AS156_21640 [Bradyrhizobium macuxiense]|uniref:DUF6916 domain-containing protein n=1 Tax=Bradyrhizobium macuxiense TaxID=1755647 RepID=A0A109JCB9_9BRAD|nr:hypothetical protein [Bradyrhizobium macuxiense]KWV46306.1 hypothetical protein AS156_21640 [Bradyrhizobium macuxiense]
MMSAADLAKLKFDDFSRHLDETFDMQTDGGVVSLKLAKVEPLGHAKREGGAFSVLFVAPAGPRLRQSIYPVVHPDLGRMEIFLVPIGPMADGNGYQSIFA